MNKTKMLETIAEELGHTYEMYHRERLTEYHKLDDDFLTYLEGKIRGIKNIAISLGLDMQKLEHRSWEHFGRFADDELKEKMHRTQYLEKKLK